MSKGMKNKSDIEYHFLRISRKCSHHRDLSLDKKNLMLFDDLLIEKNQNTCELYYVGGRYGNVNCFHLAQIYFKLWHQTIEENANFICLFPQDLKNVTHIFEDRVISDMNR